jgi:hypothetical protein
VKSCGRLCETVGRVMRWKANRRSLARSLSWSAVAVILLLDITLSGCSAQGHQSRSSYNLAEEAALASDAPSLFPKPEVNAGVDYDPWE